MTAALSPAGVRVDRRVRERLIGERNAHDTLPALRGKA